MEANAASAPAMNYLGKDNLKTPYKCKREKAAKNGETNGTNRKQRQQQY